MSNLVTKNCDHKTCEKLYATDSNNWWWAYRKNQVILFGQFNTSIYIGFPSENNEGPKTQYVHKDVDEVLHFCGQEHLLSWVNENVGRIIEAGQKEAQNVRSV